MLAKALERFTKWALSAWRDLSLDARVVALFGVGNWFLLFANHTTVAATHDVPLWQLFPPGADVAFLIACGSLLWSELAFPERFLSLLSVGCCSLRSGRQLGPVASTDRR